MLRMQMTSVMRSGEDQLLLLASDGLWDVFTNEEACSLALDMFRGELARTGSGKQVWNVAGHHGLLPTGHGENAPICHACGLCSFVWV